MIISIEGNIGSGKSTLLSLLEKVENLNIVPEDVETWKNEGWLELFYSDIRRYAGTFQLRTQISHMHNKNKFVQDKINIVERSPLSNKYIFGKMLLEDGLLHPLEFSIIGQVNELMGWNPDKIVILLCDPEVCFKRIEKRNREGENIPSLSYLESLHQKHLELKNHFEKNVCVIDTTNKTPEEILDQFLVSLSQ
jgi:deoxyadenosine/deoxycytidine kinase